MKLTRHNKLQVLTNSVKTLLKLDLEIRTRGYSVFTFLVPTVKQSRCMYVPIFKSKNNLGL